MAKSEFLKTGAVAAIAALLALTSMPSAAMAQDRGQARQGRESAAAAQNQSRSAWRGNSEARQQRARPAERATAPQRTRPAAQPVRTENPRANNGGAPAWRGNGRDGERAGVSRERQQAGERLAERRRATAPQATNPNMTDAQRARVDPNWRRPDTSRPGVVRNNDRDRDRARDTDRERNGWKSGRRDEPGRYHNGGVTSPRRDDDRRWSYSNGRYNWNRDWRNDRRYDWNDHRRNYRQIYSPGRYRAPHSSYYYRPLSIGYRLNAPFYGNSYWIADPWDYRLPQAYGPYRWVRYYDDVLLVNIHNGSVVDVIRNFFW